MTTHFYTATSLDGFIATTEHSLDWLLKQDFDGEGPMAYPAFVQGIGALAMGAATYEWVREHDSVRSYEQPTWVFTHRDLAPPEGADVRFTQASLRDVHAEMTAEADGQDIWAVGGGRPRWPVRGCGAPG